MNYPVGMKVDLQYPTYHYPLRPWGASDCPDCGGVCTGHYLKPVDTLNSSLEPMVQPPSVVLKNEFAKLKGTFPSS